MVASRPWRVPGVRRRKLWKPIYVHVFTDDSSSFGKEGFSCLAGCVARDGNWDRFVDQWDELLGKHKMLGLHTSDFLTGNYKQRDGSKSTRFAPEERMPILQEFMDVVRNNVEGIILIGMNVTEYRAAARGTAKHLSPSDFLFLRLIKNAHTLMQDLGSTEPLSFIFDDNPKIAPRLYSSWSHLKRKRSIARTWVSGIMFGDDTLLPPLQAADLIACGLVRSQREGSLMWDFANPFNRIFVNPSPPRLAVQLKQEFWNAEEFAKSDSALWRAKEEG